MKKLFLALMIVVSVSSADDVLVKAMNKDRVLKLQNGKQIKLKAGMELIRSKDGKLYARKAQVAEPKKNDMATPSKKVENKTASAKSETKPQQKPSEARFRWFVGADVMQKSIKQQYTYKTDRIDDLTIIFEPTGDRFRADGNEYKFDVNRQESGVAASFGLKDTLRENRYLVSYQPNKDFTELVGSAEFGFSSLRFLDRAIPYARVSVGAGFVDGVGSFKADSFSYGLGAGVSYMYGENFEFFGGVDMLIRNWGEIPARSTKEGTTQMVSYGTEAHKDSEMRIYLGARYLF